MAKKKKDFSKERMDSGITRQQALDITTEFLDWYIEYLIVNQPGAVHTIGHLEETLNSLGGDINEVCES
jgi:hypothetical protein